MTNAGEYSWDLRKQFEDSDMFAFFRQYIEGLIKRERNRVCSDIDIICETVHAFAVAAISCTNLDNSWTVFCHDDFNVGRRALYAKRTNANLGTVTQSDLVFGGKLAWQQAAIVEIIIKTNVIACLIVDDIFQYIRCSLAVDKSVDGVDCAFEKFLDQ